MTTRAIFWPPVAVPGVMCHNAAHIVPYVHDRAGEQVMDDDSSMKRRLAAILAADIAGYSRLMGEDEAATVRDLKGHQAVILPLVGRYGGGIIDTADDGILAEFPSVINATECAVAIQTIMATRNEGVPEPRRMRFRIGINLGDVIHDESRIYGDGINVAARLEGIAEPGGICISRQVCDQVNRALKADFQALGPRTFKNIARPVTSLRRNWFLSGDGVDLNDVRLFPTGTTFLAIERGVNYAEGVDAVASAVPEPGTLSLLGAGLVGLAGMTWRQHRPKQLLR